jgi:hypothetical protein
MRDLQKERREASVASFPPVLAYAGFLNVAIVIQIAKPTENTAQPMDAKSAMNDIFLSPMIMF